LFKGEETATTMTPQFTDKYVVSPCDEFFGEVSLKKLHQLKCATSLSA